MLCVCLFLPRVDEGGFFAGRGGQPDARVIGFPVANGAAQPGVQFPGEQGEPAVHGRRGSVDAAHPEAMRIGREGEEVRCVRGQYVQGLVRYVGVAPHE